MATATVSDNRNAESGGTVDPPDRNSDLERRWWGLLGVVGAGGGGVNSLSVCSKVSPQEGVSHPGV